MNDMSDGRALKLISPLTWQEVFGIWEKIEGPLPHWIEHYKKRGFASWKEWRTRSTAPIHPETLTWELYDIVEPMKSIPSFRGGPFHSWINNIYEGVEMPPFSEIVKNETIRSRIHQSGFIERFPSKTTLTGLRWGPDIVVIEGMHRCCTIALATQEGRSIPAQVSIALASFPFPAIPFLGHPDSPT